MSIKSDVYQLFPQFADDVCVAPVTRREVLLSLSYVEDRAMTVSVCARWRAEGL